jgi:tetratricopeptide (TPR) repeat protein
MIARSFRRLAAVSLTGAAFLAAPASAQTRDEAVAWCLNKQHTFTPELVVRGCTSLVQVRNAPANIAGETYRLRADAYYDQKDYARANADYDQALRLDPGNTLARNNREALLQGTRSTVGAAPQVQVAAGDGSIAGAIMIQATSENAGVDAETQWLKRNLPGWARMGTQATVDGPNGRKYDRIEMRGPNGATKTIYFDVTSFYGKD